MAAILDDPGRLESLDGKGMLRALREFPEACRETIKGAEKARLGRLPRRDFDALVVLGMGGSAIGGLLLRDWLMDESKIPIVVSRGYHIPGFTNKDTLVFAVSYSGKTEETFRAYQEANTRGCSIVCFTSGGKLSGSAKQRKLPVVTLPKGYQPRAAFPHQFFSLATIAKRLGLVEELWDEVEEALAVLEGMRDEMAPEEPRDENPAKRLAINLYRMIPFVYGSRIHESVAYRYSTQLNENSKVPAASSFFPEAFHNSIMAREAPEELLSRLCTVIIRDPGESTEVAEKTERFIEMVSDRFGKVIQVEATGEGRLSRILSALYIGDYASVYLAFLNGLDPGTMESIDALKRG
jgi:glucose/mannose-6-phosphate isomerase